MSVYAGTDPTHFEHSIKSIINQTLSPSEILLIIDGPISDTLKEKIANITLTHPTLIEVKEFNYNRGLGEALKFGVEHCKHEFIARMDSDDISLIRRFELQACHLINNPKVDVVGSHIAEFQQHPDNVISIRKVPLTKCEVANIATFRCPMNHPSVMFRKESVLNAGNYSSLRLMQDYELWLRMLNDNYYLENLDKVLVKCRIDNGLFHRRGGLNYYIEEIKLHHHYMKSGYISPYQFVRNIIVRGPIRLLPPSIRKFIYIYVARNSKK